MNSQDVRNAISGVLVVDKPVGMTSHDVVQAYRFPNAAATKNAQGLASVDVEINVLKDDLFASQLPAASFPPKGTGELPLRPREYATGIERSSAGKT